MQLQKLRIAYDSRWIGALRVLIGRRLKLPLLYALLPGEDWLWQPAFRAYALKYCLMNFQAFVNALARCVCGLPECVTGAESWLFFASAERALRRYGMR